MKLTWPPAPKFWTYEKAVAHSRWLTVAYVGWLAAALSLLVFARRPPLTVGVNVTLGAALTFTVFSLHLTLLRWSRARLDVAKLTYERRLSELTDAEVRQMLARGELRIMFTTAVMANTVAGVH